MSFNNKPNKNNKKNNTIKSEINLKKQIPNEKILDKNKKYEYLSRVKSDSDKTEYDLPLKSVNGRRCLSKCYPKNTTYLHPILLTGVANNKDNTCAINPVHTQYSGQDNENDIILADKCRLDDNKIYQAPDELESILLGFYFNPRDFLTGIYGLYSFDQVIYWTLDNDYLPLDTIKRVHNCAWRIFGNKIEEITSGVLEYYYDISKKNWLKDYSKIIEKKYSFDLISKKPIQVISNSTNEIYDILNSTFFTYDFFINGIRRYVNEYQDEWENINSHYGQIKKYILYRLMEKIDNELDKNMTTNNY